METIIPLIIYFFSYIIISIIVCKLRSNIKKKYLENENKYYIVDDIVDSVEIELKSPTDGNGTDDEWIML